MKPRSIKELLQVMLDNQDLFEDGLCKWVDYLGMNNNFTSDEYCILKDYIQQHKPVNWRTIIGRAYYWKDGNIKPRIRWTRRHIKWSNSTTLKFGLYIKGG